MKNLLKVVGLTLSKNTLEEIRTASKTLHNLNLTKGLEKDMDSFDYPTSEGFVRLFMEGNYLNVVAVSVYEDGNKNPSLSARNEMSVDDLLYIGKLLA